MLPSMSVVAQNSGVLATSVVGQCAIANFVHACVCRADNRVVGGREWCAIGVETGQVVVLVCARRD